MIKIQMLLERTVDTMKDDDDDDDDDDCFLLRIRNKKRGVFLAPR